MEPRPEAFSEAVQRRFAFLDAQGFTITTDAADAERLTKLEMVRYANRAGIFVEIFLDRRENHTGFNVGFTSSPSDGLSESELRVIECAPRSLPTFPLHRDRDQLTYLAWLLENFGFRVLAGDVTIFEEARTLRRGHTERFT